MSTRPRLLIVEDEPDAAAALRELLEARGYDVRIAATAAKARVSHAEWQPDLVLMDLMLPDASGLELLREIKDSGSQSEVIMVSRWRDKNAFREYTKSGDHRISHDRIDPSLRHAVTLERLESIHTYEVVAE